MADKQTSSNPTASHFPPHDGPRVWVLSSGDSPIGISVTRQLLEHGDYVVAGVKHPNSDREDPRTADFEVFLEEVVASDWKGRLKPVTLDIRSVSECQAAVAAAIHTFGRVDVLLCCTSQATIGSVEELAASEQTRTIVKDQFETNYFGPVNLIKAVLRHMRRQRFGHILSLGGITGHIGTPGLGVYCAAGWALEGFCDSLAYEVAPFNIRVTIIQCSIEILILSNLVTSVPPIYPAYSRTTNPAPLFRGILNGILSHLPAVDGLYPSSEATTSPYSHESYSSPGSGKPDESADDLDANMPLSAPYVVSLYPPLSNAHLDALTEETVYAITAIGGHENPPARHIVGSEGVASVKEKLKTVSEELEDFISCSCAVDINSEENAMRVVNEDNAAQVKS
ncbi:hypothetical protein VTO42DRAFT_201 [Malbranchea cinnamomea]